MADSSLQIKDIPLTGKLVTSVNSAVIGENYKTLKNMRYTDTNIESIGGMSKINSTALTTYLKVRSGYHYRKDSDSHILVQAYNTGLTASVVLQNTIAIPGTGDFSATVVHTDTGTGLGRFSAAPTGEIAYCNGAESLIWAGNELRCSGFVNYDPSGSFSYDYTDQVTNTLTTEFASVSLSPGGIDANVMLLLHLDNNVTDSSPTTPHTVTNNNVTFSSSDKVFGTHSAVLNGTTAYLTAPDNADFDFSGGTLTIDARIKVDDLSANYPIFYQEHAMSILAFTSGGTYEVVVGNTITGQLSAATAIIEYVELTSGTWAGGTAAGNFHFRTVDQTGTFQAENINVGAEINVATIGGNSSSNGTDYFHIRTTTTGGIHLSNTTSYGANNISLNSTTGIISAGTWYHVEIVESGNSYYIFVNGVLRANTSSSVRIQNHTSTIYIGYDTSVYFKGKIDEYRISNNARHTSGFDIPVAAYSSSNAATYFYVGSIRPIKGIKFYVGTANTSASTLTVQYWNGSSWTATTSLVDGTSAGGISLAQTGTVTFTDTELIAKLKYLNQIYIYWYKVYVTSADSGTTIYSVTLDTSMQSVKDIWDGTARTCLSFQKFATSYQDNTINIKEEDYSSANTATYADIGGLVTSTQYLVAGFAEKQSAMIFTLVSANTNTTAGTIATVKYWSGSAWVSVGDIDDGTLSGGISFSKSGVISWNPPSSEFKTQASKEFELYYYRLEFSQTLSANVKIDYMAGIPAQNTISNFKFPIYAQDRLWLCSDQSRYKNSVLVSAYSTSSVFNGSDSTRFYFGDNTEVTAGASIYSQFGSSLYDIVIIFKRNETWLISGSNPEDWKKFPASQKIGCAAPLTVVTAHVNTEVIPGLNRHIAIWQSSDGIYAFDGRTFLPLHADIDDLFDKRNTSGLNRDKIGDSVGFFDDQNQEYHWIFASGNSTTLNREFVFDLKRQRWFEIERSSDLQFGVSVSDSTGNTYNYGFIDTGYMLRLENGTTSDGTAITGTMETGDIYLSGSPMIETSVRVAKLTMASKSVTANSVTLSHYGDSSSTATMSRTLSPASTGKTIAMPLKTEGLGPFTTHRFKMEMTTSDETIGFEPLILSLAYKSVRIDKN